MNKRRFWFWLSLPIIVIILLYFGSYLICLHTATFGGGGSFQRVPCYVNPLTGRMLPHHLQACYFFQPAQKIDAFIRPGFWWGIDPVLLKNYPEQFAGCRDSKKYRSHILVTNSTIEDFEGCKIKIEGIYLAYAAPTLHVTSHTIGNDRNIVQLKLNESSMQKIGKNKICMGNQVIVVGTVKAKNMKVAEILVEDIHKIQ